MSDIVEQLKEPELHYPGNFRTPLRANALLSFLCQEAAETIESLRQQLAMFNSAVEHVTENGKTKRSFSASEGWAMVHKDRLIDLECAEEQLSVMITKAGEVMRDRILDYYTENYFIDEIRALPGVTLEDLQFTYLGETNETNRN